MQRIGVSRIVLSGVITAIIAIVSVSHAQAEDSKTTVEDLKRETKELSQELQTYSVEQKDEALKSIKTTLDRLDARIDKLEKSVDKSWDDMNDAAREEARANLKALREQRTKVAEWYGSLKASSVEAWDAMKAGFSDAYQDLSKAWQRAIENYDSEE
ncbi:hypothetical protein [Marinobacter caseinilyticus]|uniref:hypothetical protein n=1 Tax=Marinobacter caseinilyticus TaxID=2692195 RepID=UPI001407CCEC|nr:hypothetical protein [Marinobacter caseinilyticus]